MEKVTNFDILEDVHSQIAQGMTLKELIKEYGGCSLYVPHYSKTYKQDDIKEAFKRGDSPKLIAKNFSMSLGQVYSITKEVRDEMKKIDTAKN